MARVNGIDLWYETFGKKQDPAVLLITGAGCQGVLWDLVFCEKLVREGFYVIRYDHRDAGLSTCFDFKKDPYGLIDLAKDAIGLLDMLGIERAHLFGNSMGGFLSEILSVHFPERVLSILLLGTTCEMHPTNRAFARLPSEKRSPLPPPSVEYLEWTFKLMKLMETPITEKEQLELRLEGWKRLNGRGIPLNEKNIREMLRLFIARLRNPQAVFNHITMLQDPRSEALVRTIPDQIKVPTVILQGSEDPVFPPGHGEALSKLIKNAEYHLLEGQGHIPHDHFYETYVDILKRQARKKKPNGS
jgi:pimeloyl-ACP methyl ester carboxylesterase